MSASVARQAAFEVAKTTALSNYREFLSTVEKVSTRREELERQEKSLSSMAALPGVDRELLKSLFKNQEHTLEDLLKFHEYSQLLASLQEVENLLDPERKETSLSNFRQSLETVFNQTAFKAAQLTIVLVNKDLAKLLTLPEAALTTLLRPLGQVKEVRAALFSHYPIVQKMRVKDVLTDFQISLGHPELYFELAMETMIRFCRFDVGVLESR